MHYFFFDAAGDPGFQILNKKGGGSSLFYVSCVISTDEKDELKNHLESLRTLWRYNPRSEFKFHTFDRNKKQPFFESLVNQNFTGFVSVLPKLTSTQTLTLKSLNSGNKVTSKLVAPLIGKAVNPKDGPTIQKFHFYIDEKKHNRAVRDGIREDVSEELRKINPNYTFKLSAEDSKKELNLQLADMIAGMVMDSYETGNKNLLRIIHHKLDLELL